MSESRVGERKGTLQRFKDTGVYAASLIPRHPLVRAIKPGSILVAAVATFIGCRVYDVDSDSWATWLLWPVLVLAQAEIIMSIVSIVVATGCCSCMLQCSPGAGVYADLEKVGDFRAKMEKQKEEDKERRKGRGACYIPQEAARRVGRWRPPQVVRWDLLPLMGSKMFGYAASVPIPVFLRARAYKTYAKLTAANLNEIEHPLNSFRNLRAFFTRTLKPGLRPINSAHLVSPVDGKVVVCGEVTGDEVEQVKGVTYSLARFLGEEAQDSHRPDQLPRRKLEISEEAVRQRSEGRNRLFHIVLYLDPGDYHRMHAPADMTVEVLRHFPGTLFPISPILTRMLPNLFALNERVALCGSWPYGAFSFTAVGAYNVGSIEVAFDKTVSTNRIRRDLRNPNVEFLAYGGVGSHAYVRRYDEAPEIPHRLQKGRELGLFNLGSTVVLIFEAPKDFKFTVGPGEKVRLGQQIGEI